MAAYKKTAAAIAKLSPEEYRLTQQSGTERPGAGAVSTTRNQALMSILSQVNHCRIVRQMVEQGYGKYLNQVDDI